MSLLARDSSSTLACSSWLTRLQFLVQRLHLLLGGGELLVGGLQFLVGGLQLLVGDLSSSWEVCISSRVVRSSSRACCSSCSSSARCRAVRPRGAAPAAFGGRGWRGHVGEDDHHHAPAAASGSSSRWTVTSTHCFAAVGPDLESVQGDHAVLLPERLWKALGQLVAQPLAGHGEDVPVGLAGGRFQVLAGPPADVEDVALVVDEHRGRGVALDEEQLIRQRSGD